MKANLKVLTLALAAVAFATPGRAQDAADSRPTLAVMYFSNGAIGSQNEELAPLSKGIADILITQLAANPGIRVVERDQLEKLLQEQNLSAGGRVDKETAVKVGRILGAHHMIFGGFVTDPKGRMRLEARAVNVETSEIEHVESVPGKTDDLMEMIDKLATKLNAGLRLPAIPRAVRDAQGTASRTPVPTQAVLLYSRALVEQDKGNTEQAVTLFRASLDRFPDYERARQALARLEAKKGA